jgi:arylsulfatase A-like enzyme
VRGAIGRAAAFAVWAGSIAALVDGVATLSGGFEGNRIGFLLYSWALSVLWMACFGCAFAGWLELSRAGFERGAAAPGSVWRRRAARVLRCTLAVLPLSAFVFWVPSSWVSENWAELEPRARGLVVLFYVLSFLGTLSVGLFASWLAGRYARAAPPRFHGLLPPVLLLIAAACYLADRRVLVGLYEAFHYGLYVGFSVAIAAFVVLVAAASKHARPMAHRSWLMARGARLGALPVWLLGVALSLVVCFELATPDVFGPSESLGFSKLVASGRSFTDFDADGVSGLFGGSDCAGFDERSGPGRFDFPGNGIDEDCSGSDSLWPKPRPHVEYPVPQLAGHDVVIISVDALRADHLGLYGYPRNTSPNLDALARRAVVFERAFSTAPTTYGSLPALLSGLYPSNIAHDYAKKVRNKKWKKTRMAEREYVYEVGAETTLLAERFKRLGYHTVGCSHVPLLPLLGLTRGFERFEQSNCRGVLAKAKDSPQPLFYWTHLYAPHAPYARNLKFDFGDSPIDRYDSEVARDDAEIGKLLALIDQRGRANETIIIVTADHGEEFREHGGEFHGSRLYRELIHVPLLIHIPGVEPVRITTPVETLSLAPTLCELVGLARPCQDFDAVSLLRTLAAPEAELGGAVSEVYRRGSGSVLRSLYDERWHLILDLRRDRVELYDVIADREEQHDVARQHPEVVARMSEELWGRPQYRAARLFEAYAANPDPVLLAQGLSSLQDDQLIEHALDELGKHPHPEARAQLERFAERPGLRGDLRARALAAAEPAPQAP